MKQLLVIAGFAAIIAVYLWARSDSSKSRNRHAFDRKAHQRGQTAIKTKASFVVSSMPAADVLEAIITSLGYPSVKRSSAVEMILASRTRTGADFAFADNFHEVWASRLVVTDATGGAHGSYEVLRWTLEEGTVVGWREMEIVARRVNETVMSMGGSVKVMVPV